MRPVNRTLQPLVILPSVQLVKKKTNIASQEVHTLWRVVDHQTQLEDAGRHFHR